MSILAPVLSNLFIVVLIALFAVLGYKVGAKRQAIFFVTSLGTAIGTYFLAPLISGKIFAITKVSNWMDRLSSDKETFVRTMINPLIQIIFIIAMLIIVSVVVSLIIRSIRMRKYNATLLERGINPKFKPEDAYSIAKLKYDRAYALATFKHQAKLKSKAEKVIGAVIAGLQAILCSLIILSTFAGISGLDIAAVPFMADLWNKSIYGLIDNALGGKLFAFINKFLYK